MLSMITTRARRVKPARRTARPAARFGAGLVRFVPFAVTAPGFVEPSDEDKAAAAALFAGDAEPDYDLLAGESATIDAMASLTPPAAGICRSCGEPAEANRDGWCDACEAIADRLATPY